MGDDHDEEGKKKEKINETGDKKKIVDAQAVDVVMNDEDDEGKKKEKTNEKGDKKTSFGPQASSSSRIVIMDGIDTSNLNFNINDDSFDWTNIKEIRIRIQKKHWNAYSHSLKENDKNTFITEMKKIIAQGDVDGLKNYLFKSFPSKKQNQIR